MPICYHCGEEVREPYSCKECDQIYCSLHIDQITHECKLVKDAQQLVFTTESLYINSNVVSHETEHSQCWFCGLPSQETFNCNKCNHSYCEIHRDLDQHDCPSLFDFSSFTEPKPSENNEIPMDTLSKSYLQKKGKIELDSVVIKNSVNEIIKCSIEFAPDNITKEFIKNNLSGRDLVEKLELLKNYSLIEALLTWLSGISSDPINPFPYIEKNNINLHQLILDHYLHIFDASYLEYIRGLDPLTGEKIEAKINVDDSLNVSKRLLTYISEHAREVRGFECFGYLKGKRDSNFKITEVDGYIPVGYGSRTMVSVSFKELIKIINELKEDEDTIVGWYHSHPGRSGPSFSEGDKKSHLTIRNALSILNYIKDFKIKVPKDDLYHVLSLISLFKPKQIEYVLGIILDYIKEPREFSSVVFNIDNFFSNIQKRCGYDHSSSYGSTSFTVEKFLHYQEEVYNSFESMKENILAPSKTANLELMPLAGMVICPELRYIAIMDGKETYDSEHWTYYRINVKDEN